MTTPTTENERRGSGEMWTGGKTCGLEWDGTALCLGWDGMWPDLGSGGGTVTGLDPDIGALGAETGIEALLGPAIGIGVLVGPETAIAALCLGTAIAALCLATADAVFGGGAVESVRVLGCETEPSVTAADDGDTEFVETLSIGPETTSLMLEIGGSDATPTSLGNSCFRA